MLLWGFSGFVRSRARRSGVPIAIVTVALTAVGCSSSSDSPLTSEQRTALEEVATAYDGAESALEKAFEAETVVPKLERWQETETVHQAALDRLRDGLPEGECRTAIETLRSVEVGQNEIRARIIENYREKRMALVAKGAVEYGVSVINGAIAAEDGVAVACGRSTVDPKRTTERAGELTTAQNSLIDAVQAAYRETRVAFNASFSIPEFVADVEAVDAADGKVVKELDEVIAALGEGECRKALTDVRELESKQSELRDEMVTAGKALDATTMFTRLDDYGKVNSNSDAFVTALRSVTEKCGVDL